MPRGHNLKSPSRLGEIHSDPYLVLYLTIFKTVRDDLCDRRNNDRYNDAIAFLDSDFALLVCVAYDIDIDYLKRKL